MMENNDASADPLGARDSVIHLETLTRWNFTQLPLVGEDEEILTDKSDVQKSPFPWRNDLNCKVILWNGDITDLSVHAIVHSTNERMSDKSALTEKLYNKAGPKLVDEIKNTVKICKTGEAKITEGFNLVCRHVIHTVGPRYNVKYITAAEGALYSSYKNVLRLCLENSLRTLGLCCVHSVNRGYPPEDGAHIAIRTVRRFLERYSGDLDTIVFVCGDDTYMAYHKILSLYFPRSPKEEVEALAKLPADIGNEMGEPVIKEREIRIIDKPTLVSRRHSDSELEKTVDLNREFGQSISGSVGQHPFTKMEENPDSQKRFSRTTGEQKHMEQKKRYERLLKRSKTEDLSEVASLRCLYRTGQDRFGRPVIAVVGKNFPAHIISLEKTLLYMIRVLDPIADKDFVVVYFHTCTTKDNFPPMSYLKTVYSLLDHKYKKNLKSFYIVHPTWWSKVAMWFFTTFTASDIKQKVVSLKGVQYLYAKINPDQLDIPPFVLDHDIQVNGPRYFVPFNDDKVEEL